MKDSLSSQHIRDEFPLRGLVIWLGILITAGTLLRLPSALFGILSLPLFYHFEISC